MQTFLESKSEVFEVIEKQQAISQHGFYLILFNTVLHNSAVVCYLFRSQPLKKSICNAVELFFKMHLVIKFLATLALRTLMSVGPPLWSRLKYLNNYEMDCNEILISRWCQ